MFFFRSLVNSFLFPIFMGVYFFHVCNVCNQRESLILDTFYAEEKLFLLDLWVPKDISAIFATFTCSFSFFFFHGLVANKKSVLNIACCERVSVCVHFMFNSNKYTRTESSSRKSNVFLRWKIFYRIMAFGFCRGALAALAYHIRQSQSEAKDSENEPTDGRNKHSCVYVFLNGIERDEQRTRLKNETTWSWESETQV